MAKAKLNFPYTSSMGDHSVYSMKGCKKLVVRAKGGPTGEMIKNSSKFSIVRNNNSEFSATGFASGKIQRALFAVKHLADYNISGRLTSIAKIIQKLDTINPHGKRAILFSKYPHLLDGFSLNEVIQFDSVLKSSPFYTISRSELSASINLPDLIPQLNFIQSTPYPLYRIICVFGIVPDIQMGEYGYGPANPATDYFPVQVQSNWASTKAVRSAEEYKLKLSAESNFDETSSLILSIGIEFGNLYTSSIIQPVKNAGCAKILAHV